VKRAEAEAVVMAAGEYGQGEAQGAEAKESALALSAAQKP